MDWKKLQYAKQEKIKAFQDQKLSDFIRHKIPFSPFYRELFEKNNLKFSDIKTTSALILVFKLVF